MSNSDQSDNNKKTKEYHFGGIESIVIVEEDISELEVFAALDRADGNEIMP